MAGFMEIGQVSQVGILKARGGFAVELRGVGPEDQERDAETVQLHTHMTFLLD
jgi:hypothetical protein